MRQIKSKAWSLVVNADIAFYPGVLRTIAFNVHNFQNVNIRSNERPVGIAFTSLCCGAEWSAVVFTKALVEAVGTFTLR
jgi:hypothetical protein